MKKKYFLSSNVTLLILVFWFFLSCSKKDPEVVTGSIVGIVTDALSGTPVQSVSVTAYPDGLTTVTGSDGHYEFQDIAAGQYSVQFIKSGYASNTKQITVTAGKTASGDCLLLSETSGIKLSISELNFGTTLNSIAFSIENTNSAKTISWEVSNIPSYLTFSSSSGTIGAGKSVSVVVNLKRELLTGTVSTNIILSSDGESFSLLVIAESAMSATVKTESVSNVTATSAQVAGNIVANGTPPITERGFCYSTGSNPTINNLHIAVSGVSTGTYTATLSGLAGSTSYHVRAYAISEIGVAYGEELQFETPSTAKVSVNDFLAISDGLYFCFSPSSDVKTYYWKALKSSELPNTDDAIINRLQTDGVEMNQGSSNEGDTWNLSESTKYTLCIIAYDAQNKQGELVKIEYTTKSSNSTQPKANITINSATANSVNFSISRNSYCTTYSYAGYNVPDDKTLNMPDIYWAYRCYNEEYKLGGTYIHNTNVTNNFINLSANSTIAIITLGFNSSGTNSGVIDKKFYSLKTMSEIKKSATRTTSIESAKCEKMNSAQNKLE